MVTLDDKNLPRNRRTYKHQRKYSNLNFVIGHTTAGVTRISNKLTKCKKNKFKKKNTSFATADNNNTYDG